MVTSLHRQEVQELLDRGAELIEVLPREEFDEEHLPGARAIPLGTLGPDTVADLDLHKPVIVYCWNGL